MQQAGGVAAIKLTFSGVVCLFSRGVGLSFPITSLRTFDFTQAFAHRATARSWLRLSRATNRPRSSCFNPARASATETKMATLQSGIWMLFILRSITSDAPFSVAISSAFSGLPALLAALQRSDSDVLLQPNTKNVSPLHAASSLSSPLTAAVVQQVCPPAFRVITSTSRACHCSSVLPPTRSSCPRRLCRLLLLSRCSDPDRLQLCHPTARCGSLRQRRRDPPAALERRGAWPGRVRGCR